MKSGQMTRSIIWVIAVAAWSFLFLVVSMWLAMLILVIAVVGLLSRRVRRATDGRRLVTRHSPNEAPVRDVTEQ
jgi:hypothetical protein